MKKFISLVVFLSLTACAPSATSAKQSFSEKLNKAAKEPDFWDGIGKILAGIISMKTGARFDYNINDRIAAYEGQGMSHASAVVRASDDSRRIMNPESYPDNEEYQQQLQQIRDRQMRIQEKQISIESEMRNQQIREQLRRNYPDFYK